MPSLTTGRWRLELQLDDGRRYAGGFVVESMERTPEPIRIAVQPSR